VTSFLKKCLEVNMDLIDKTNTAQFARVEIVPYSNRNDKIGNLGHFHWLQWSRRYPQFSAFKAKISHDKTRVDFNDMSAFEAFEETWTHYYRRIY
jgi:hypothetical protein